MKILFSIAFLFCMNALAVNILIVTDQPKAAKANELKKLFAKTPPFSLMKALEVSVQEVPAGLIKCRPMTTSNRVMDCYENELRILSMKNNADRTIFLKDDERYGGSGGFYATATTGSPTGIGMHEFLHYFGFADEYAYTEQEAQWYCDGNKLRPGPNIAIFDDKPPYKSDENAKSLHNSMIPWSNMILPATPIVKGPNLGTPFPKKTGLYAANLCPHGPKTWKPEAEPNIMSDPTSTRIPEAMWPAIAARLHTTLGFNKKAEREKIKASKSQRESVVH